MNKEKSIRLILRVHFNHGLNECCSLSINNNDDTNDDENKGVVAIGHTGSHWTLLYCHLTWMDTLTTEQQFPPVSITQSDMNQSNMCYQVECYFIISVVVVDGLGPKSYKCQAQAQEEGGCGVVLQRNSSKGSLFSPCVSKHRNV